ncbi:GPO family capsid scaffolding protein [Sphingomonas sp. NFR15]|uniref:GPO family capsid scaffolding protein n=1 Tax=Sphingomonas sp. NFR15 TaxID=1566282 RepID=UPI00088735D2|nr:GPO family capsid scaffolding protein [Sphingomonas sp. NFR15]SDA21489.1 Phage capsid scaffolding protein (GPO) serine peptidase [Sphingomonas sp. NFR15]
MAKSKFFRAFVEGQTISDGRKIDGAWIDQIAQTFNTETYTPRINIEHISGYSPEPPFNGYGNVVAVKVQTDDFSIAGKTEQRKALYCQVEDNGQLAGLVEKGQKPFPSVELTDSYAGTGKVGLIGLAFTDKPASIGTQALQFSRSAPGSLFSDSLEAVTLEFEAALPDATKVESSIAGFFSALTAKFAKTAEPEKPKDPPAPANDNAAFAAFATEMGATMSAAMTAALKPLIETQTQQAADFAELKGKLTNTEQQQFSQRQPATGSPVAGNVTDC